MVHQMKIWQWFAFCWIIQRLQLLSASSRNTLMLAHFQKKLDVFQSDMELLKFDMSNIQHTVSNLTNTCHCKENDKYFENSVMDANSYKVVNTDSTDKWQTEGGKFTNNLTGIVKTVSQFSDSDKKLSNILLKALNNEKKHTRAQLDKMLDKIEEVHNQEKIFQTDFEGRYSEHEKQVKQMESNIYEMVQQGKDGMKKQIDSEIETLMQNFKAKTDEYNTLLSASQQEKTVIEVEFDNKLRAYQENIDKLTTILKKNEQELLVMKEYINKTQEALTFLASSVDIKIDLNNCLNPSDNWIPNKELRSSFLVVVTPTTWHHAKEQVKNKPLYKTCTNTCQRIWSSGQVGMTLKERVSGSGTTVVCQ